MWHLLRLSHGRTQGRPKCAYCLRLIAETDARSVGDSHPSYNDSFTIVTIKYVHTCEIEFATSSKLCCCTTLQNAQKGTVFWLAVYIAGFFSFFIVSYLFSSRRGYGSCGRLLSVGDGERVVCRWQRDNSRDVGSLRPHAGRQMRTGRLFHRLRCWRPPGSGETLLRLETLLRRRVRPQAVSCPAVQEGFSGLPGVGLPLRFR